MNDQLPATAPVALTALDDELAAVPGTVSVWCGPLGGPPSYSRLPDVTHYAASTMKAAVLAALHRAAERGDLDLDRPVPVANDFGSARPGAGRFGCDQADDNDDDVWARVGGTAPLRWLAERMIVRSSNLATNVVLNHVGVPAVAEVWREVGARNSVVARGIEDAAAREAGIDNVVSAADLAALLSAIVRGAEPAPDAPMPAGTALAGPDSCAAMLRTLLAQEHADDLATGLPRGTRIAHKNGWIRGIRHGAAVVFPADTAPYALVVCTTTSWADQGSGDRACALLGRIAAASWADRHQLN